MLGSLPTSSKPLLAIHGGLGNPQHSVIRLYADGLKKLNQKFDLVAIDPIADSDEVQKRRENIEEKLGIKYKQVFSPKDFFQKLKLEKIAKPHGIFVLTPVAQHIKTLKNYLDSLEDNFKATNIIIEKPLCSLSELDQYSQAGVFGFLDKLVNLDNQIYAIDSAMLASSLDYCLERKLLNRIGKITKISAIALDHPIKHPQDSSFEFNNKLETYKQRGLLTKNNGGAGFSFDMGIHSLVALSKLLQSMGFKLEDAQFTNNDINLEAINAQRLSRDKGQETYMNAKFKIKDIELNFEAGKASDIWDRRIEIYGEKGSIIIGLGTLKHKNYLQIKEKNQEPELIILDSKDSGYEAWMHNITSLLNNKVKDLSLKPQRSLEIMKDAMNFFASLFYSQGKSANDREQRIKKVNKHLPSFESQEQKPNRELAQSLSGIYRNN